jgi:hypothetical protein
MKNFTKKGKHLVLIIFCFIIVGSTTLAAWLLHEQEYLRVSSPNGEHTAIVTYRRYEEFLPRFPGQTGDKAGFIRIEDSSGVNYGKIAIPMVWMSRDLQWTEVGASLKLVADWDFNQREYRYWNEEQTQEFVIHVL